MDRNDGRGNEGSWVDCCEDIGIEEDEDMGGTTGEDRGFDWEKYLGLKIGRLDGEKESWKFWVGVEEKMSEELLYGEGVEDQEPLIVESTVMIKVMRF